MIIYKNNTKCRKHRKRKRDDCFGEDEEVEDGFEEPQPKRPIRNIPPKLPKPQQGATLNAMSVNQGGSNITSSQYSNRCQYFISQKNRYCKKDATNRGLCSLHLKIATKNSKNSK